MAKKSSLPPDPVQVSAFKQLLPAFKEFMDQKPYQYVYDSTILGVQAPGTDEVLYAYVMGALGEVVGFNVYTAENVTYWIQELEYSISSGRSPDPDIVSNIPMWQVAYARANDMSAQMKALNQAAGVVFKRGVRRTGIEVLKVATGKYPVPATKDDMNRIHAILPGLQYLITYIAANMDRDQADTLTEQGRCLVAVLQPDGVWTHDERDLPKPKALNLLDAGPIPQAAGFLLQGLQKENTTLFIEAGQVPGYVRNDQGELESMMMIVAVEPEQGLIIGFELTPVAQWKTEGHMAVAKILQRLGAFPAAIYSNDQEVAAMLQAWEQQYNIPIQLDESIGSVLDQLGMMLGGMGGL